jgi:hypothetical protein
MINMLIQNTRTLYLRTQQSELTTDLTHDRTVNYYYYYYYYYYHQFYALLKIQSFNYTYKDEQGI